jgi:NitT/TauT family transport system substrate-binding protein
MDEADMRRARTRHLAAFLAGALFSAVAFSTAQAQNLQKIKVAIGASGLYFITHFVAEGGGFFKREGYELDTVDLTTGPRQVAAVMGGSVDIAPLGLQLVVQATSRGGSIVAISSGYNILPMSLVLSNDAIKRVGITAGMSTDDKIRRIKGLRIGITGPGSGTDDMARTLTGTRGLDPDKDIIIQPLGNGDNMLAALEKGVTDGFVFTSPIPETAVARGLGQIVVEPLNGDVPEANNVPYIILATNPQTMEAKKPMLEAAVRAWTNAMKFTHENKEEARRIVRGYFKQMDEAVFNAAFDKYVRGVPTHPVITEADVEKVATWMSLSKKTKIDANYANIVSPQMARDVGKSILGK